MGNIGYVDMQVFASTSAGSAIVYYSVGSGPVWDKNRHIRGSVRLATVVSELTGCVESVPACCGPSSWHRLVIRWS